MIDNKYTLPKSLNWRHYVWEKLKPIGQETRETAVKEYLIFSDRTGRIHVGVNLIVNGGVWFALFNCSTMVTHEAVGVDQTLGNTVPALDEFEELVNKLLPEPILLLAFHAGQ